MGTKEYQLYDYDIVCTVLYVFMTCGCIVNVAHVFHVKCVSRSRNS